MIQINQPEIEALIHQRLESGAFQSVEQVLLQALKAAPLPAHTDKQDDPQTGADLIAALRNSPFFGLDIDFESSLGPLPVREVNL